MARIEAHDLLSTPGMKAIGFLVLVLLCAGMAEAADLGDSPDAALAERLDRQASVELTRSLETKVVRQLDRRAKVVFYDAVSKTALIVGARSIEPIPGARPVTLPLSAANRGFESAP